MTRLRVELIPTIGFRLAGQGVSALVGSAYGLRRLTEDLIWGRYQGPHHGEPGCCCHTHHHYRVACQPRCYDCDR